MRIKELRQRGFFYRIFFKIMLKDSLRNADKILERVTCRDMQHGGGIEPDNGGTK
jgi:hypothetical protein